MVGRDKGKIEEVVGRMDVGDGYGGGMEILEGDEGRSYERCRALG